MEASRNTDEHRSPGRVNTKKNPQLTASVPETTRQGRILVTSASTLTRDTAASAPLKRIALLHLCVSSLRRVRANFLCIVPISRKQKKNEFWSRSCKYGCVTHWSPNAEYPPEVAEVRLECHPCSNRFHSYDIIRCVLEGFIPFLRGCPHIASISRSAPDRCESECFQGSRDCPISMTPILFPATMLLAEHAPENSPSEY